MSANDRAHEIMVKMYGVSARLTCGACVHFRRRENPNGALRPWGHTEQRQSLLKELEEHERYIRGESDGGSRG